MKWSIIRKIEVTSDDKFAYEEALLLLTFNLKRLMDILLTDIILLKATSTILLTDIDVVWYDMLLFYSLMEGLCWLFIPLLLWTVNSDLPYWWPLFWWKVFLFDVYVGWLFYVFSQMPVYINSLSLRAGWLSRVLFWKYSDGYILIEMIYSDCCTKCDCVRLPCWEVPEYRDDWYSILPRAVNLWWWRKLLEWREGVQYY